jgi:hypothetical protein
LNDHFGVFLQIFGSTVLGILACQAVGLTVSAGVPMDYILTLCILLVTFLFGYGGLFVPVTQMSPYYSWLVSVDLINYTFNLMMNLVFDNPMSPQIYVCAAVNSTTYPDQCGVGGDGVLTGRMILQKIGVVRPIGWNVFALFVFCVVFRIIAYYTLRYHWVIKVNAEEMLEFLDDVASPSNKKYRGSGR